MSDLTNIKEIKDLLGAEHTRAKKHYGQNFLLSKKVIDKIVSAAELSLDDSVLEIGPGMGVLTIALAKTGARIITVEKDSALIPILESNLQAEHVSECVTIINSDILEQNIPKSISSKYVVVANIPYQITAPILWKFLHEETTKPSHIVIMIQKEVADRLLAFPGNMTLLSVLAQFYAKVTRVVQVKRTQFYPPPRVDSTVVKLKTKSENPEINHHDFFKLVKAGFASKRKKLKNNLLSLGFDNLTLTTSLAAATISESARAQELSVADWLKLYKVLYNNTINN